MRDYPSVIGYCFFPSSICHLPSFICHLSLFILKYKQQILQILSEVGERGISVRMLAKHVYNMNCTLFSQPDPQAVHHSVQQYLLCNSKSKRPLVESTGRRGFYRLNNNGRAYVNRLVLKFTNDAPMPEEKESERPQQDFSLSLFSNED